MQGREQLVILQQDFGEICNIVNLF